MVPRACDIGGVTDRKDEVLASESEFFVIWTLREGDSIVILINFAWLELASVIDKILELKERPGRFIFTP